MKYFYLLFFLFMSGAFAQEFRTEYTMETNSEFRAQEDFYFEFTTYAFIKIETYNNKKIYGPSKIEQMGYSDDGSYYELRAPTYVLEESGVLEYEKYPHYFHKVIYDKRGGNILCVFERDMDKKYDKGKFYFTAKGNQWFSK